MEHSALLRPRHLLMLGFLALSMACSKAPSKKAPLASSLEKPSPTIEAARKTKPISYPYSVVPGGVHGKQDLAQAIVQDPVVAAHYKNSRISEMEPAVLKEDRTAYVSYRVGEKVYWTVRMVTLHQGENVLTDGEVTVRARCGNQISEVPQVPVLAAAFEPSAAEFDQPIEFRLPPPQDFVATAVLPSTLFANLPVAGRLQEESPGFESPYGDMIAFSSPPYFSGGYGPPVFFGGSSPSFPNSPIDSGTSPPNSGPVFPPSSNVPFPPGTIVVPPPIMPPPNAPQPPFIPIPIDPHVPETPVAPPGHTPPIPPVTPPAIPPGTPTPPGLPPLNPPVLPPGIVPPGIVPPPTTPPHNPPELPPNSPPSFPPSEPPATPNVPELNTYLLAASGFLAFGLLRYLVKDKNKPDDE